MIRLTKPEDCCGCTACLNICPKGCISMKEDAEGFLYPYTHVENCIDCHLCEKICPILHSENEERDRVIPDHLETPPVYAARCSDRQLQIVSSSGGIFSVIAEHFFQTSNIRETTHHLYGVRWNEDFSAVKHDGITEVKDLPRFRGSKYLQSDMGTCLGEIKKFLKQGHRVLFSGTPCQVMALRRVCRGIDQNLFAVSVACHSVPSPKIWKVFLADLKRRTGIQHLHEVSFRKRFHHTPPNCPEGSILFLSGDEGSWFTSMEGSTYGKGFLQGLYSRPSCHACPARGANHGCDLLIGDFWGIENHLPELKAREGVSLIICCTEKGKQCLNDIEPSLSVLEEAQMSWAIECNGGLTTVCHSHPRRSQFFEAFFNSKDNAQAVHIMERFTSTPWQQKLKNKIKRLLKKVRGSFTRNMEIKH